MHGRSIVLPLPLLLFGAEHVLHTLQGQDLVLVLFRLTMLGMKTVNLISLGFMSPVPSPQRHSSCHHVTLMLVWIGLWASFAPSRLTSRLGWCHGLFVFGRRATKSRNVENGFHRPGLLKDFQANFSSKVRRELSAPEYSDLVPGPRGSRMGTDIQLVCCDVQGRPGSSGPGCLHHLLLCAVHWHYCQAF